jgi:hypothetical protein
MRWVVLLARVPAEPSRHRVAIWRELRRLGAVAIGQSVWALPDHPAATNGLGRIAELVDRGDGDLTMLDAAGRDQASGRMDRVPGRVRPLPGRDRQGDRQGQAHRGRAGRGRAEHGAAAPLAS